MTTRTTQKQQLDPQIARQLAGFELARQKRRERDRRRIEGAEQERQAQEQDRRLAKARVKPKPAPRPAEPATMKDAPFGRIVCINLDRRPDRWAAMQERVQAIGKPFAELVRFRAVDGSRVKPPAWWKAGGGAWGVYATHLRILEDAIMDGLHSVLILEDDALFIEGFPARLNALMAAVPADWHHLYLGGQHLKDKQHPPTAINDHVVRCHNVNRCHAHALRGDYICAAYQHLADFPALAAQHADARESDKVKAHHVDHRLGLLHESGKWNVYAPAEWLVGQVEGRSDICAKNLVRRFWQQGGPTARQRQQLRLLITGHPRSGTTYMARLMQAYGLDVCHEKLGADGISSWMFAVQEATNVPYGDGSVRRAFDFETIVHVVRHPLKVLASSMQTEAEGSLEFRRRWSKVPAGYNAHEEAVHILLAWDRLVQRQKPTVTVRVEDAADVLPAALGLGEPVKALPARNINTRKHGPLAWKELREHLRPELAEQLQAYAERHGYDLGENSRSKEQALKPVYDSRPDYYTPATADRMAEITALAGGGEIRPGMRVLDLGCGNGRTARWFAEQGCDVVGVDYSTARIDKARQLCPAVAFHVGDVYEYLESHRQSFDVIACFEVLEHLEQPERLLSLARASLNPGGAIIGTVPINLPAKQHLSVYESAAQAMLQLGADRVRRLQTDKQSHAVLRWQKTPRYLVLGSAPYINGWWAEHHDEYRGWTVCAINNAWSIAHDESPWWYVSRDFGGLGTMIPTDEQRDTMMVMTLGRRLRNPFRYDRHHGAMMILETVYDLLNRCVLAGGGEIHIAGSDLVYPSAGDSHFYGKGRIRSRPAARLAHHCPELAGVAADPLRKGSEYVIRRLARAGRFAAKHGVVIRNAGDLAKSHLPFDRAHRGSGITAVVPSVNYADMLKITLPAMMKACNRVIVVTEVGDASVGVAERCGAEVVLSERRQNGGLDFDKGALINDGLSRVGEPGWVLLTDADTILSPHLACLRTSKLDRGTLYGTHFRVCPDAASWRKHASRRIDWGHLPEAWEARKHRLKPGGCFQLFWMEVGHQHPEGQAGLTDYEHVDQFAAWTYLKDPMLVTVHLGPLGMNHRRGWFRSPADRRSPIFAGQDPVA